VFPDIPVVVPRLLVPEGSHTKAIFWGSWHSLSGVHKACTELTILILRSRHNQKRLINLHALASMSSGVLSALVSSSPRCFCPLLVRDPSHFFSPFLLSFGLKLGFLVHYIAKIISINLSNRSRHLPWAEIHSSLLWLTFLPNSSLWTLSRHLRFAVYGNIRLWLSHLDVLN